MKAAKTGTGLPEEHSENAGARPPQTPSTPLGADPSPTARPDGKRVLHVDTGREWRGGQTQLLHLVGRHPGAAVALAPDAPLRLVLEALGVPVYPVWFGGSLLGGRALARAADEHGAELLAAHTSHAHTHALATGLPVVVHRRLDFAPSRWSRAKYERPLGYVAVSAGVRDVLVGFGVAPERIAVVHDAVAPFEVTSDPEGLRAELGWPADATVLLAVGALVDHKGHRWLIDAMRLLPGMRLAICGEGPLRSQLARQARDLGDRVRLLGRRTDVPRLLGSVDLLVHPSTDEGMGQAVVEALIAGVPVVASAVGGLPEVVGELGRLVAPADPVALAAAIEATLADPDARAKVVAAGPAVRARHRVDRMVAETLTAYEQLMAVASRSS